MNYNKTLMISHKSINVGNWLTGPVPAVDLDPSTAGCDVMWCDGVCWSNKYKPPPAALTASTSTLCKLWFYFFLLHYFQGFLFFFNWRDIRLSSLWEDSAVETYVDQPPQQMSDSRLQHATSAAAAAAASPTSAASSWFTAHNTHSPSENTLWDLVFNKISLFSLMWMWCCTLNHETQIWRILLRSKNYILM